MADVLETTIDKFTFRVPTDRLYSRDGLWIFGVQSKGGNRVRVGLTDYLQQHGGDVAFMNVKPAGTKLQVGDDLGELETVKVNMAIPSPVSGVVLAANDALELTPELVNQSPYEKGWLAEIDAADWNAARASLLDAKAYFTLMQSQAEEELRKT